jgi:hypothetical protein
MNLNLLFGVIAVVSVLHTYFCVQAQNWQWWWRAFWSGFLAGGWMFVYCVYHMVFVFGMDVFWGDIVFLIYSVTACVLFGFLCGFVSVFFSFVFVQFLYSRSKSD